MIKTFDNCVILRQIKFEILQIVSPSEDVKFSNDCGLYLRKSGIFIILSIGAACGGFGVILGFLLEILEVFWKPLPGVIIGTSCILGPLLVFALPETKGRKLPETIEDVLKTVE